MATRTLNQAPAPAVLPLVSSFFPSCTRQTVRELDGTRVTYSYDRGYQLATDRRDQASAYDNTYFYDKVGNRTVKNEALTGNRVSYTCNAANEMTLIQEPGNVRTTLTYDGNGNTLAENRLGQITSYSWDFENRLTGQVDPDGSRYTYTYRGNDSRRVKNETPDGSTRILVWDELNCLQELDGGLSLIAQYTDYPGQWGGLASQRRGVNSSYYGFDVQWTGRVLVAQTQLVSDTYTNDAWGVELASTGSTVNPYRYVGQWGYRRETSKRSDVWHRQLQRELGRFTSVDPIGSRQRPYAYVSNTPLLWMDPTGLQQQTLTFYPWLDVIIEIGLNPCATICWLANLDPKIDKSVGAAPICGGCPPIKCGCVLYDPVHKLIPGQCPEFDKCAISHEEGHFGSFDCPPGPGISSGKWRDGTTPLQVAEEECRLRAIDYDTCLPDACKKTTSNVCRGKIDDVLGEQWNYLVGTCKTLFGPKYARPLPGNTCSPIGKKGTPTNPKAIRR